MVINSSATCPPNRKQRQNKTNIKLINITLYTLRCGPLTETHHKARTRQQQNKNSYRTQNNRKTIQQHCQGVEEISLRKSHPQRSFAPSAYESWEAKVQPSDQQGQRWKRESCNSSETTQNRKIKLTTGQIRAQRCWQNKKNKPAHLRWKRSCP